MAPNQPRFVCARYLLSPYLVRDITPRRISPKGIAMHVGTGSRDPGAKCGFLDHCPVPCGCCAAFENGTHTIRMHFEGHDRPTRKIILYAGYVGVPVVLYSLELAGGGHNVVASDIEVE